MRAPRTLKHFRYEARKPTKERQRGTFGRSVFLHLCILSAVFSPLLCYVTSFVLTNPLNRLLTRRSAFDTLTKALQLIDYTLAW